ncbi:hypothetical protein HDE69_005379 [Pedobacter cryoconitis]|uniref:Uncharacterized protein n=1 Tax=Pedobacter cryoconitis TaxID=188932 RepID=A0A7W9DMH4_9SPHI|nr:hypothetical protein [Pedobacter cryoconitis]MBB5624278.1 hypothetical protein [Pedobacter cryoconitis]MBB5644854.1 hypothetical protein [Pedobacter cryoconitis]
MDRKDFNLNAEHSDAVGKNDLTQGIKDIDVDQIPGPAGTDVNLDGVQQSSNLYPLEQELDREGATGHEDEDLGINSDGTNPGTEYFPPLNEPSAD